MSISGQISQEARFFLISVLAGAAFLFGYGLIRGVRREFPAGRIRIGLEDFFYWACAGAVFFSHYISGKQRNGAGILPGRYVFWHVFVLHGSLA